LGGDVLGRRAVAGQVDDVRVDGVELPGDDLGEAGAGGDRCRQGRRGRVHARLYGAAPAIRHTAQGRLKSMRRLLVIAAALVLVDTMLYAALTPLLQHFLHEFGLSKSRAGILVAAYAGGALVGGFLGGLAATHFGSRRAVLAGLALMGLSSLGFAFADTFWTLFGARLLQGLGSGFTWSGALAWLLAVAPRERRG